MERYLVLIFIIEVISKLFYVYIINIFLGNIKMIIIVMFNILLWSNNDITTLNLNLLDDWIYFMIR